MSFSIPKENQYLFSFDAVKNCLQLWCWNSSQNYKFHRMRIAYCQGTNFLAVKIFEENYVPQEVAIKNARGRHKYEKLDDGIEEFTLSIVGENSFNDMFALTLLIKVKDNAITEQKIELEGKSSPFY